MSREYMRIHLKSLNSYLHTALLSLLRLFLRGLRCDASTMASLSLLVVGSSEILFHKVQTNSSDQQKRYETADYYENFVLMFSVQ